MVVWQTLLANLPKTIKEKTSGIIPSIIFLIKKIKNVRFSKKEIIIFSKNLYRTFRTTDYKKLIKNFYRDIKNLTPAKIVLYVRRHLPLVLAIVFLAPAFVAIFIFVSSKLFAPKPFAATFTGAVKISKQSTTLSTDGDWYTAMAYSGDGVNGDAESGTFNPIHPGGTTDGSAGGLAVGYVPMAATATYAAAQFIGFTPSDDGNIAGVQIIMENITSTSLSNSDIVVELLRFPSASCTSSCSNYVTGTQGAYTYPSDTVVERRTVWQFNQATSGENSQPGNFGRATLDFRFDPPLAVDPGVSTTKHYGIRIINMGATAPATTALGVWGESPQSNGFASVNGTVRTLGVIDIDATSASTMNMPPALTSNSVLGGSASLLGGMVVANSSAGVGLPTARRTENEHWTATYSSATSDWTIVGSVSGTQARKLTTATDGATGASWVDDGATLTTLTANSTATTVICVASTTGFAANQYIDIWDSDTATIQRTIASVTSSHASCSDGPAIVTTSAMVTGYTTSKNASVARSIWKQRIIQGAHQTVQANTDATAVICVEDNTKFATGGTVAIYDNNSPIITRTISSFSGSCGVGQPITLNSSPGNGTYTTDQSAKIAEVSVTLSNTGTPSNGNVLKWTSINHAQNPTGSTLLARTTSVVLAYAKSEAVATSSTRYPFLSNRHIYFVAYGDANTTAPADGDMVIVGNGKSDPDTNDSSNLSNDINWATKESHVVTIDRNWDAGLIYTGNVSGAVGDGAGSRTDFAAYTSNGGWVSALVTPGSQLGIDNSANKHYRINIPGKIVVESNASVAFGKPGAALPASSYSDIHFDNVSPAASTTLTVDSAASTTLTVTSTTGFAVGDTIILDDNNSVAITRVIAAIQSGTSITLTAAAVTGYTTAQGAYIAKGITTELPTGSDRRAGVFTMTGIIAASTQTNFRTGRVSLYADGSSDFRTSKSDLAVDIDGNIDTGYLGNNLTDAGNTWVDVEDNVVGNWQPTDEIAVGGGTNLPPDNNISTLEMGSVDDAAQMPLWTGGVTAGGKNDLPAPNMEVSEIGTVPLTNIYNANYNGGSVSYSSNYANSTAWTIFGDSANSEVNDAVYFADQGNSMFYSLEFNIGTLMSASASYVWEFWNGSNWISFTPRDSYIYQPRTDYSMPLSADITRNSYTITIPEGGANFGLDQIVMIDDDDSSPIYRRLGTTAPTATVLTFAEPLPSGYTTAQNARVSRLNGGHWVSVDPTSVFSSNTGRKILSWTPSNLTGTPAKTTINSVNAYWVRARISSFSSWTTSPANQTTPIGMSGIERLSSGAIAVSSGVQEAKLSEVTPGASYDPNETWTLEYGNSPGWIETQKYTSAQALPSAPYIWHIDSGTLNVNATNVQHLVLHNGSLTGTDYTISALVKMDMVADATSRRVGVMMRQNLDGNGYAALITKTNAANTIGWYTTLAGVPTLIGSATTKAFSEDTWYCLKAQVSGTTLNAKFWATSDCSSGEPGSWDETETNATYTAGRFGLYTGSATASQGMKALFDTVSTDTGFSDTFTDTGTWNVVGSTQGSIGTATPGTPFTSSYINFTLKHKGGRNGVTPPEIGDKIYLSSTGIRSYKGLDSAVGITTSNGDTKYELWDFEWDPTQSKYTVTGSATGSSGTATPGTTYTSPDDEISLRIPSGSPTATKFGDRMLLLQDNYLRNNGSWTGVNGIGSAVLVYPTYAITSSSIATRYNIEGQSGTASARQNGTIDFWFKANYSGSPSNPKGAYLVDYANLGDTNRLFIRHTPDGYLEAAIYAAAAQGTLLRQSFSPTAGQWYHFRLAWDETANAKRAWLDGTPFTTGQASTVGTRGANAGLVIIGNRYTYDAAFDGSIDEFAIFDDDIDTSAGCNYGSFTPPSSAWTGGETVTCSGSGVAGTNIFRASFDSAMNPREGWVWADYAFGNPSIIFTNGADTGNERIRVITYPQRTRVWVDNTGDKYTPSARIKSGSGFLENAALATLTGWSNNFTYHHKAKRESEDNPTYSPVLNLKRNTHIWSTENISYTGATTGAPINAGLGFGPVAVGLSGLATLDFSDVSMENQYSNFSIVGNPYTSAAVKPTQRVSNSVFYNFYDRAYTVSGKTEGTNYVGAYFVTTNFAAANIGSGYNASTSQNVGIDGSIFMGNRNAYVTVPPAAANGAAAFFSGRLYTVSNSEFYNNGVAGSGTSGALNFSSGVAKVTISNNIFSINNYGIRLYGNSFFNMSDNVFDGHTSSDVVTVGSEYGSGIRFAQTASSIAITDDGSVFGRGLWNESDINTSPNTATFEAESLAQFTGSGTQFLSPVLFGTAGYTNMSRIPEHYFGTTIPGTDIRGTYSTNTKDIVNFTTFGNMRTTGQSLSDTTVRTSGGYSWRMEPTSADVTLDYTAKVVGVATKPLAVTGYIYVNDAYGSSNLPTVTLSGLGMTGDNLTWTASDDPGTWQQFVVSGTPTESALAELVISVKNNFVASDSGTNEVIALPIGNYLPPMFEDVDKSWTPNQWVGYKLKDSNGKIFDIVRNTSQILYLKGTVVPFLRSTTFAATTVGDYVIYEPPYVYIDDVSILSGSVDTGTLDFYADGQPVSPWLSTGLTAEGVWAAQYSNFADTDGSFGQLLQDSLVANYANVSDPSATTTSFNTNLTSATDNFYNDGVIIFTEGQNTGVVRRISDYAGASKTITLDPALPFSPANGNRFAILAATSSSTGGGGGASAADIWSYALRSLTTADLDSGSLATQADIDGLNDITAQQVWEYGTRTITGEVALTSASRSAIWDSACSILNTSGSVGKRVCDNLDAAVSSRSTLTAADVWAEATRTITGITDPALAALANSVWSNGTRELTDYGNDITAQQVWDVLTSSLTTIDSIGKLLVTNVDDAISTRASQSSLDAMAANVSSILTEIGSGNISAIKTKTDTINWTNVTGLVTTAGEIKTKTDTIDWTNVTAVKTKTDTISWADITGIKLKTDTIDWGDIDNITTNIATLLTEVGTGNIDAIKTSTDTIDWSDVTGLVTTTDAIKLKTDTIDWANITAIKTKTDTITWADITGIKLKTDTIDWGDVTTIASRVDTTVSSRASQASLDSHEAAEATFRTNTTATLGAMSVDIAAVLTQLSTIETKIDTIQTSLDTIDTNLDIVDTNLDSVKLTVEDTNTKVSAIQTVTNNILGKWGENSAATIIGYIDTLESSIGLSSDATTADSVYGKLNYIKANGGGGGGESPTLDLVYTQVQATHTKLMEVQTELGLHGKTSTAYEEMVAIKELVDNLETGLAEVNTENSDIAASIKTVSDDLKEVTDRVGKVSTESFTQLFEVNDTDTVYLRNKLIELQAVSDINRQLLEKTVNEPIVKVVMEWGSVIIKFVLVNPSDSTTQTIPFKAFLPKEVKQEYIMDLGGLDLNYDTTTEQYYVTADITLQVGESVSRSVEIKDIWVISEDEIASLKQQAEEMSSGLKDTPYFAQGLTLKTDVNTRLDKIARKQKDNNATPQDHIMAYRENVEDMKAVQANILGMKDLVMNSGASNNFIASVGGIQTFATWGIVLVLIFGMGALGTFYYQLWKVKVLKLSTAKTVKTSKSKQASNLVEKTIEIPTPMPHHIISSILSGLIKRFTAVLVFVISSLKLIISKVLSPFVTIFNSIRGVSKKTLLVILVISTSILSIAGAALIMKIYFTHEKDSSIIVDHEAPQSQELTSEEKLAMEVEKMNESAKKTAEDIIRTEQEMAKTLPSDSTASAELRESTESTESKDSTDEIVKTEKNTDPEERSIVLGAHTEYQKLLLIKQTPTEWLNVRDKPALGGNVITKVYPGETYPFSEVQAGWYKILLKDLTEGWVSSSYVTPLKSVSGTMQKVQLVPPSDSGLNIRESGDANSRIIKTLYVTAEYPLIFEQGDWAQILLPNSVQGWVYKEYVNPTE